MIFRCKYNALFLFIHIMWQNSAYFYTIFINFMFSSIKINSKNKKNNCFGERMNIICNFAHKSLK